MSDGAVRVSLVQIDDANETIELDLVLAGGRPKRGLDFFGVYVDKSDNTRCPFIVGNDGRIDYGSGFEGDDQFYDTDILSKTFAQGEHITVRYEGEEFDYKITKIAPLA